MHRVVITGIGIASPIGIGKQSFLENCFSGKIGISECDLFSTEKLRTNYFGCIPEILSYLPEEPEGESRTEALARIAAEELLDELKEYRKVLQNDRTCFCFGTLLGHTLHGLAWANGENSDMLAYAYDFIPHIRKMFDIKGGSYVSSAACSSGTAAAGMALEFIRNGIYDRAVIGGVDPLSEVSAYGFHSLKNLSPEICNPFDENRNGINIGEGSAFLLAETLESALERNAVIYGELAGYGLNNDAYHITAPDPEGTGAYLAMKNALQDGKIQPEQVQYINAHGTGTIHNELMETKAISHIFENNTESVHISSLKGQIGHCMGASGVLELAALLLAMQKQFCLPQPSLKQKMPEAGKIKIRQKAEPLKIEYALSNSFAFAGNTASILVRRYSDRKKEILNEFYLS